MDDEGVCVSDQKLMVEALCLLSSIYFYGGFVAESVNERRLEKIMNELGLWPTTEQEVVDRMQEFI